MSKTAIDIATYAHPVAELFLPSDSKQKSIPVYPAREGQFAEDLAELGKLQKNWLKTNLFSGKAGTTILLPGGDGAIAGVVLGIGKSSSTSARCSPARLFGSLARQLPPGRYHLSVGAEARNKRGARPASPLAADFDDHLAAEAWGLGGYRFNRYCSGKISPRPVLKLARTVDLDAVLRSVEAVWFGRDLINTPSNDLGPEDMETAARRLARQHKAKVSCITGDDLLAKNFPLIHAVGRASSRAPRLIDMTWGKSSAVKLTLIGKGICFDTGGLDIKPANGMLLMKKDMGGAAAVLALAHMVMQAKLPVRLRVIIPVAENSISANAFRPGDIITSRSGTSVEIGNTDAEGRLVLADALSLADEYKPDYMMTFATLTGAARVALGPDLPPFYVDDDAFAASLAAAGNKVCDPVWRMPFWQGYESMLDSPNADINNVAFGGFAGSITAALFLRRFARNTARYAHFDIYGWRPDASPLAPKGGDVQAVRAVFSALEGILKA